MQTEHEKQGTVEFMDPLTGEVLDEWQEGCLEIEVPQEEVDQQPDSEWLPDYYMQRLLKLEAQREILQAQHKLRMDKLTREGRSLKHFYEDRLEQVVKRAVIGGKKRSVDYAYGTAGLRKSKRVEVEDEDLAMDWAEQFCEEAVRQVPATRRLLKSFLPKTGEIPGVERVEVEKFYVRFPK